MTKSKKKQDASPKRTNGWDMCQSVLIYGMRSGQLIGAVIGLIFIIAFLKMSGDQIYTIFIGTGALFSKLYVLGWVAFVGLLFYTRRTLKKLRMSQSQVNNVEPRIKVGVSNEAE